MKEYQNLSIFVEEINSDELIEKIKIEVERQKNWEGISGGDKEPNYIRFRYSNQEGTPIATVFIIEGPAGVFNLTQIIPIKSGGLPKAFYNLILNNFKNEIIDRTLAGWDKKCRVEVTTGTIKPEDKLPSAILNLLNSFVVAANKTALHPYDEDRWRQFLMGVHQSGIELGSSELQAFLIEDYDWPDDSAHRLAVRFEEAMELLKDYDKI